MLNIVKEQLLTARGQLIKEIAKEVLIRIENQLL